MRVQLEPVKHRLRIDSWACHFWEKFPVNSISWISRQRPRLKTCLEPLCFSSIERMHEIGIMQSTLDAALDAANASAATQVLRLRLRIGAMTGVVPEALQFAFEALREGTIASEAQLEIESVPVRCWCNGCGREFEPLDEFHDCPVCGHASADTRAGLELELVSIEIK